MLEKPESIKIICAKSEDQHQHILELFNKIKVGMRKYISVKPLLRQLQEHLLEYVSLQNKIMDRVLTGLKEEGRFELKKFEFFEVNLKDIKIQTLTFIEEYPADLGDVNPKHFIDDFKNYSTRMVEYFQLEKEYLIPIFKEFV